VRPKLGIPVSFISRIEALENPKRAEIEPKLTYAISLIYNLESYIIDCPVEVKCKLISSMFPEKIEFDGFSYRTNSYNAFLDLVYQQTNELRGNENAGTSEKSDVPASVPRADTKPIKYRKTKTANIFNCQIFTLSHLYLKNLYFLIFSQSLSLFCPPLKYYYYLWKPNESKLKHGFQIW